MPAGLGYWLGCWLVVAAGPVRGGIRDLFEGLVPAEVIEAYDRLLARDGCAKDQAGELLGDAGLVQALTDRGMAHVLPHTPADPAWLRPASPDLALQGVLAGHQNRLAHDQEILLDGHHRLADAQAGFGIGMNGRTPGHLVSVVADKPPRSRRAVGSAGEHRAPGLDDAGEPEICRSR